MSPTSNRRQVPPMHYLRKPGGQSPYDQPPLDPAPPATPVAAPSGFCKHTLTARYQWAVNNAGKWRERYTAALSPLAPQYALYGRTAARLGVLLSPPAPEVQIPEADRQFHARLLHTLLLHALRPVWLTAAVQHACGKQGNHLGRPQLWQFPGGKVDHSSRITIRPTMFHTTHQRLTLSASSRLLDVVETALRRLRARAKAPRQCSHARVRLAPRMVGRTSAGRCLRGPLCRPRSRCSFLTTLLWTGGHRTMCSCPTGEGRGAPPASMCLLTCSPPPPQLVE